MTNRLAVSIVILLAELDGCASSAIDSRDAAAVHDGSIDGAINADAGDASIGVAPITLALGLDHTCMLRGGVVKCWGRNDSGQLGLEDTRDRGEKASDMGAGLPSVKLGTGRTAKTIVAGYDHTCAILDNDSVKCWGKNAEGRLGVADLINRGDLPGMGDGLVAVSLGTGRTVMAIAAGNFHTCAILDNGSVKCWGGNADAQIGAGDRIDWGDLPAEMGDGLPIVDLGKGRTAKAIAAGDTHTCARLDNGAIKCWGGNRMGQLGLGDHDDRGGQPGEMGDALAAVNLGAGRTAKALAMRSNHACVLLDNGAMKCWGRNTYGQLGLGDKFARGDDGAKMGDALTSVDLGTGRTAKAIVAMLEKTCAVLDDDRIKCWGNNAYGQLGQGDRNNRADGPGEMGNALAPVQLGTGRTVKWLAIGGYHACAVLDDDRLKCWGRNTYGQLGLGDIVDRGDETGPMGDALPAVDVGQ